MPPSFEESFCFLLLLPFTDKLSRRYKKTYVNKARAKLASGHCEEIRNKVRSVATARCYSAPSSFSVEIHSPNEIFRVLIAVVTETFFRGIGRWLASSYDLNLQPRVLLTILVFLSSPRQLSLSPMEQPRHMPSFFCSRF